MTEALLKGFALGMILTLSVGPVIFTIIKQSINNGKEGGFSFVAGVWISDILLVVLSNTLTVFVGQLLEHTKAIAFFGGIQGARLFSSRRKSGGMSRSSASR